MICGGEEGGITYETRDSKHRKRLLLKRGRVPVVQGEVVQVQVLYMPAPHPGLTSRARFLRMLVHSSYV